MKKYTFDEVLTVLADAAEQVPFAEPLTASEVSVLKQAANDLLKELEKWEINRIAEEAASE